MIKHPLLWACLMIACCSVLGYKEFALSRTALEGNSPPCTSSPSGITHTLPELCYFKDVSHHMQLFIDDSLYYVGVDLTAPISWLKSPDCKTGSKGCSIIATPEKVAAEEQFKNAMVRFRIFGRQHGESHAQDVAIVGSSDLIAGELQNVQYAEFYAKDSRNTRELTRLLGLSLFLTPEKDLITISNSSIMKAERLSQGANGITDGAIAFNPKLQSSSLLSQLFANSESGHQVATIFLHPRSKTGTLSIGDISMKYTLSKASQITWTAMQEGAKDVISCLSAGLSLRNTYSKDKDEGEISISSAKDVVFTTSSSYIFLPDDSLEWLQATLKKRTHGVCKMMKESKVFRCEWSKVDDKLQALMLTFSVKLMQNARIDIPITTLTLISDGLFIQFAILPSSSGRIILGEPFFEQYVAFLDYGSHRIGFAPAFFHQADKFHDILIYFLRLILFGAILLLLAYLCFNPCVKIKLWLQRKIRNISRQFQKKKQYESFDELAESQL